MARRKNHFSKGPNYQRYFFAYSDKMLMGRLSDPTDLIQTVIKEKELRQIIKNEALAIEFPQTTGDINGRYGVIVIPEEQVSYFFRNLQDYEGKPISPRELDPTNKKLVFLKGFDLNHTNLGGLGSDFAEFYKGTRLTPYRTPVSEDPIQVRLANSGYPCIFSTRYMQYENTVLGSMGLPKVKPRKKEVFGIMQDPQLHIHQIKPDESQLLSLARQKLDIPRF